MHRFRAAGFVDVVDEASFSRACSSLARIGRSDGRNTLIASPFDEASVRLQLWDTGDLRHVEFHLDSQPQPFLITSIEPAEDEMLVAGFTSLDGKPGSPLSFHCPLTPIEPDGVYLSEISGFAESITICPDGLEATGTSQPNSHGAIPIRGPLLKSWQRENVLTGQTVTLRDIFLPGHVLRTVSPNNELIQRGTMVQADVFLFGRIAEQRL